MAGPNKPLRGSTKDAKTITFPRIPQDRQYKEKIQVEDIWEEKKKRREREAMLRGMSRAGKYWGRIGAYIRREGFHPLRLKKASEWFDEGRLFFDDAEENNKRKTHCKICGKELMKGEGHRVLIYASNWYNLSFYFSCEECKRKLEITALQNRILSG